MARDYKHRARGRRKQKQLSPWLGVAAGLLVGLFIAFLVFIRMQAGTQSPQAILQQAPPAPAVDADRDDREPDKAPEPARPRFEFYDLLPEMEVVVPEYDSPGEPRETVKQVERPGTYMLQVGSFKGAEQAGRRKAELALLGFETRIQTVTIDGRDTWHRVRVGPFSDLDALNQARRTLNQRGIESRLVQMKEGK